MDAIPIVLIGGVVLALMFVGSLFPRTGRRTQPTTTADSSYGGDLAWMDGGHDAGHGGDCGGSDGSDGGGCDGGGDGGGD